MEALLRKVGTPEVAVLVVEDPAPSLIPPRRSAERDPVVLKKTTRENRDPGSFKHHPFYFRETFPRWATRFYQRATRLPCLLDEPKVRKGSGKGVKKGVRERGQGTIFVLDEKGVSEKGVRERFSFLMSRDPPRILSHAPPSPDRV
jgi:hypothetical protein